MGKEIIVFFVVVIVDTSWRVCRRSRFKRVQTYGTYHGQLQTLYTPFQLQRVAMSAPCRQKYSHKPCCSTLSNACGMKML